jgi:flagellar basal body-associated protein FliL
MIVVIMVVMLHIPMVMFMAVVPQLSFVEQEKKQQAKQQGDKQIVRLNTRFKGFRQEVQERCGQ